MEQGDLSEGSPRGQAGGDGDMDQGAETRCGEKGSDSGYVLKLERTALLMNYK